MNNIRKINCANKSLEKKPSTLQKSLIDDHLRFWNLLIIELKPYHSLSLFVLDEPFLSFFLLFSQCKPGMKVPITKRCLRLTIVAEVTNGIETSSVSETQNCLEKLYSLFRKKSLVLSGPFIVISELSTVAVTF